jgi:hypothetical protein
VFKVVSTNYDLGHGESLSVKWISATEALVELTLHNEANKEFEVLSGLVERTDSWAGDKK